MFKVELVYSQTVLPETEVERQFLEICRTNIRRMLDELFPDGQSFTDLAFRYAHLKSDEVVPNDIEVTCTTNLTPRYANPRGIGMMLHGAITAAVDDVFPYMPLEVGVIVTPIVPVYITNSDVAASEQLRNIGPRQFG